MKKNQKQNHGQYDDIEFSQEVADAADQEAMKRMQAADKRATEKKRT
ncbi:YfhD family protein [Bacillus sp. FJAT-45037]|nr:YfhD family protein [Bacillus sp. FJAT-45037]